MAYRGNYFGTHMHTTQKLKQLRELLDSAITNSENIDHFERSRDSGLYSPKGLERAEQLLGLFRPHRAVLIGEVAIAAHRIAPQEVSFEAIVRALGPQVEDSADMRAHLKEYLDVISARHAADRARLLSDRERTVLTNGMSANRQNWDNTWIGDIVSAGYYGARLLTDVKLIEDVLCDNLCLDDVEGEDRAAILAILSRDDVLDIVCNRFHTNHDQDAMERFVGTLQRISSNRGSTRYDVAAGALCDAIIDKIEAAANMNDDSPTDPAPAM